ncbi:4-methylaminobutanoate oxidase (formaldehyde-forming) [Rhizobium rhizogenes]|uniref:4-methylaminobutanoate oxidase (Formaldehyde-forming) n=2 Tax=Rhizobium/Agrobacterium group TaxID=227290 RepID=A0AAN2A3W6_RHIRH|nr:MULTISPECIES: FAD-dependent oxidoreductase [Rhizobium/Agrobacterium group]AQS61653.1 FAD-dependent oxidoreductase [Rhizobium rhizogenes]MCZ7443132.1 FAD-dependent oxidoreductase [Rhizobium rhizogenes]NSX90757.1 FAD-dependent oxidoreductase [Agrobacterium tumefaciens]NSZ79118.1 FAD-dependent oxidoreductase [Agrobacterium tumefaciens]NTE55650.1 FAD-dependent oxidoreductase [Agrobacterium tumefaciens]
MKTHARAVVIGGGVVGVSTLYHLAKKGWSDSVLIERKELTSGSTWHAAGLLPLFNMSYSVGQIHKYSVKFYEELQEETGMNVGFSKVSNIRLARTKDRWDEYMYYAGIAETIGVRVNMLTPEQVKEIWPLCETDGLLGAIQHPDDGYIQPADLTQALAKGARDRGATIYRNTTVTAIEQLEDGHWKVTTDKGEIIAEHIISCTGSFARKTGEMVGINIPVIPVEHQYIVTEPHPAIQERRRQGLPEMGVLRESDSAWYMREEAGGLILGPYEVGAPVCYVDGPSDDSEYELFQEELDRLMPHIETAMVRVPAFGEVGIKKVYNGAIAYTPDGNPIVGPAPGLKNFWLNEGHSFGITAAGGAGWQLAEWIVDGEPTLDLMGVDPRRFGPYATEGYLIAKNEEAYANVFTMHYPDEERSAARPLKTTPVYDRLKKLGGVFGSVYGWERANWYAPEGYALREEDLGVGADVITSHNHAPALDDGRIVEKWSFRRSNYFEHVGNEVKNVHQNVGVLDMSAFAKMEVSGPGARAWLDSILANAVPKKRGRIALTHLLTPNGGVKAEFTVYEWAPGRFYMVSAGGLEAHDHDVLRRLAPTDGSVVLQPITQKYGVLVLAGPKSRDLLKKLTRTSLENKDFPWLTGRQISVGVATAHALRVNFVGELGWELHHPIEMQNYIFDRLMEAGAEFGIKPFGIRAMVSMSLEKSYRNMGRELSVEYNAYESGLDRFLRPEKSFIGRDALVAYKEAGVKWVFSTLTVSGNTDVDARGSEAIFDESGALAGRATSGGFGWRLGKSIALAMLKPEYAAVGTKLKIRILGTSYDAEVVEESPFDTDNALLRA